MRDELTDEQRARLCILEEIVSLVDDGDAFLLTRLAHWVETGRRPDQDSGGQALPEVIEMEVTDSGTQSSPARWGPAVR